MKEGSFLVTIIGTPLQPKKKLAIEIISRIPDPPISKFFSIVGIQRMITNDKIVGTPTRKLIGIL